MREFRVQTERRSQLIDVTQQVRAALGELNGAAAVLVYGTCDYVDINGDLLFRRRPPIFAACVVRDLTGSPPLPER